MAETKKDRKAASEKTEGEDEEWKGKEQNDGGFKKKVRGGTRKQNDNGVGNDYRETNAMQGY